MAITYGIDLSTISSYATSYSGNFITAFYTVGTNLNKKTYSQIEWQLSRPLRTNEGIKIEYRVDQTATFTTIGTYTYANLGAVLSHNVPADIPACEQVQFKISLTGSSTTPSFKTLRII